MSTSLGIYLQRAAGWGWLLLCGIIPISGRFVPVPLAVAVILLLIVFWRRRPMVAWDVLWPLFVFYILHIIGMAWSSDLDFGLFDLQIKLGLVLLPLASAAYMSLFPNGLHRSMVAFTVGTFVAIVLSFWKGYVCFRSTGDSGCFAQSTFSFDLHPSYAAWYACWALGYWGLCAVENARQHRSFLVQGAIVLVLSVFTFMLASKSGVLGLMIVALALGIIHFARLAPKRRIIGVVCFVGALVVALVVGGDRVAERMRAAWQAVEVARSGDPALYASGGGSEMRLVAWQCSSELLGAQPFGSGTGDVKHALVECYISKGATLAAEKRLNSHSQFLQGGVALGWLGLLSSLLVAVVPLVVAVKRRDVLLALFSVLFMLNAAVESVLEVQAGVVLVGIMSGLLAYHRTSYSPHPKDQRTNA